MRFLSGIALSLGALLCSALFLVFAITKIRSGTWLMYVVVLAFGLGALGCFIAARQRFTETHRRPISN